MKKEKLKSMKMFLDSGAHSLFKEHVGTSNLRDYSFFESDKFWQFVDEYALFIKANEQLIDVYVSLDVIFNPELSWKVQKYLESKHKLKPMPVFHAGEDFKWLKKYIDNYDYVGIGGLGQSVTKAQWIFNVGDPAFTLICDTKNHMPRVKTHGFAMTSPDLILTYPFFSVDSVTGDSTVLVKDFGRIRIASIEELYWSALGKKVKTKEGHFYKETPGLETYITDEEGKGFWTPVTKVFRHEIGKDIFEVLSYGGRKLKLTADHGCFVVDNDMKVPVKTDQLMSISGCRLVGVNYKREKEGTLTSLTIDVERRSAKKTTDPKEKNCKESFPFTVHFTKPLMEFFGLWIADGCYSGKEGGVGVSCANDVECLEVIKEVCKTVSFDAAKLGVRVKANNVDCAFSDAFFKRVMQALGFVGTSHTKQIPWWVFELPDSLIAAFLRGYLSGDGSANGGKSISCTTVSKKLFNGVFTLLTMLGFNPIYSDKSGKIGGFSNGKSTLYSTVIGTESDRKMFLSKIGFLQKRKNDDVKKGLASLHISMEEKNLEFFSPQNDEVHLRCRSVTNKGNHKGAVYDLEVPNGQRYVANGLLVHNSTSWMQFGKYGLLIVPKKINNKFDYRKSPTIVLVSQRKGQQAKAEHFNSMPKQEQKHIIEYIESNGYKLGKSELEKVPFDKSKVAFPVSTHEYSEKETIIEEGVCNNGNMRDMLNLQYYLNLEKHSRPYPWAWSPERKQTRFIDL